MANIKAKINLSKLTHVISKTAKGAKVIVIPIKENDLFESEKGNIFLDITLWEQDEDKRQYGQFRINQSYSKEKQEELKKYNEGKDKSDKKYAPTLGNADFIGVKSTEVEVTEVANFEMNRDDLPF